jgi:ATP-binding cassette, subfamily B, bacterial
MRLFIAYGTGNGKMPPSEPRRSTVALGRAGHRSGTGLTVPTGLTPPDRLLIRTCVRAPGYSVLLLIGLGTVTVASLLMPAALAAVASAILAHRATGPATIRLAALLAAYSLSSLAATLVGSAMIAHNTAWLSRRLFRHVISLGVRGQETFPPDDTTRRLLNSVPAVAQAGVRAFEVFAGVATSVGALCALWLLDWRLGCACVISAALLVFGVRPPLRGAADALAQPRVAWRFAFCLGLTEVCVLVVAGLLVAENRLSAGAWLAAAGYTTLALGAFGRLNAVMEISRARVAATRVCEVLRTSPDSQRAGTARPGRVSGHVTFRGVTVRAGGRRILDGVDLHVPAGITAAIVGRPGAGKTTLVGLLGLLNEPDEGDVLLDGVAISSLHPADLHRAVAYAFTRPASLGRTIADHIGYGAPHLGRAGIEPAARIARAHDFIERLPLGYDTPLADASLSDGERQRLGIARAVAADARVLVLDDATSSLDTATEAHVNEALRELRADKTTLVITHRVRTAAQADTVIWLDDGRVRASAAHQRLWSDPDYRAIFLADPEEKSR